MSKKNCWDETTPPPSPSMIELALELVEDLNLVQVTHFARAAAPVRNLRFPDVDVVRC